MGWPWFFKNLLRLTVVLIITAAVIQWSGTTVLLAATQEDRNASAGEISSAPSADGTLSTSASAQRLPKLMTEELTSTPPPPAPPPPPPRPRTTLSYQPCTLSAKCLYADYVAFYRRAMREVEAGVAGHHIMVLDVRDLTHPLAQPPAAEAAAPPEEDSAAIMMASLRVLIFAALRGWLLVLQVPPGPTAWQRARVEPPPFKIVHEHDELPYSDEFRVGNATANGRSNDDCCLLWESETVVRLESPQCFQMAQPARSALWFLGLERFDPSRWLPPYAPNSPSAQLRAKLEEALLEDPDPPDADSAGEEKPYLSAMGNDPFAAPLGGDNGAYERYFLRQLMRPEPGLAHSLARWRAAHKWSSEPLFGLPSAAAAASAGATSTAASASSGSPVLALQMEWPLVSGIGKPFNDVPGHLDRLWKCVGYIAKAMKARTTQPLLIYISTSHPKALEAINKALTGSPAAPGSGGPYTILSVPDAGSPEAKIADLLLLAQAHLLIRTDGSAQGYLAQQLGQWSYGSVWSYPGDTPRCLNEAGVYHLTLPDALWTAQASEGVSLAASATMRVPPFLMPPVARGLGRPEALAVSMQSRYTLLVVSSAHGSLLRRLEVVMSWYVHASKHARTLLVLWQDEREYLELFEPWPPILVTTASLRRLFGDGISKIDFNAFGGPDCRFAFSSKLDLTQRPLKQQQNDGNCEDGLQIAANKSAIFVTNAAYLPSQKLLLGQSVVLTFKKFAQNAMHFLMRPHGNFRRYVREFLSVTQKAFKPVYIYLGDDRLQGVSKWLEDFPRWTTSAWRCSCAQSKSYLGVFNYLGQEESVMKSLEEQLVLYPGQYLTLLNSSVVDSGSLTACCNTLPALPDMEATIRNLTTIYLLSECDTTYMQQQRVLVIAPHVSDIGRMAVYNYQCNHMVHPLFSQPLDIEIGTKEEILRCGDDSEWTNTIAKTFQPRLAPGRANGEMMLSFTTFDRLPITERSSSAVELTCILSEHSQVKYGLSASDLSMQSTGCFKTMHLCGPLWSNVHHVLLNGLVDGKEYFYSVGSNEFGWSEVYSFKYQEPRRFAVFGDAGYEKHADWSALEAEVVGGETHAVMFLGDLAYDIDDFRAINGLSHLWEGITSRVPFLAITGNHDTATTFEWYKQRFASLAMGVGVRSGSNSARWWSYDAGLIHWLALDSTVSLSDTKLRADMLNWLREDLKRAATNRGSVPWIVVMVHSCFFMSAVDWKQLGPLLDSAPVDMVLCGHRHTYVRLYPARSATAFVRVESEEDEEETSGKGRNDKDEDDEKRVKGPARHYVDPPYPVSVVVATGGSTELFWGPQDTAPAALVARELFALGYGLVEAHNSTALCFQFKQIAAVVKSQAEPLAKPEIADEFWILRSEPPSNTQVEGPVETATSPSGAAPTTFSAATVPATSTPSPVK